MGAASIHVEGVGKRFARYPSQRAASFRQLVRQGWQRPVEHFWALRDVSFVLERGEMLGVIGHNGSGKSTLLRLLGGVMRPDVGHVRVEGRIGGLLQLGVGFHSDLTGRENVFTSGIIAGLTRREVAARFDDIVAFAELEDFIDSPLRTYSTGMRMRLGFATAVHTDPDVLLIDEVLTVGDLAFQRKCLARIEQYKAQGCAIVFVSHSLSEVQTHCEQTLWLRGGQVAALGASEVVIGQYSAEMLAETRRRTPSVGPVAVAHNGVSLRLNENRFGSLEMTIRAVRLLDAAGHETREIRRGEGLCVEITYEAPEQLEAPIFNVSISDQQGRSCFDVSTDAEGMSLPSLQGVGCVALNLDRLDLSGGDYFVNVGIYERAWAYTYDYHWHVYSLHVQSEVHEKGIVSPPRRWSLQTDGFRAGSGSL